MQYRVAIDLLSWRYACMARFGDGHTLRVCENESSGLLVLRYGFDSGDSDVEEPTLLLKMSCLLSW
ncbi:MAG: hypothetical protein BGN87_09375 [Rhizobiales bacterium 65-79]|jgi:hypothetical protein|nr:MAG: hypothetical protein BGN87_09375 [Rhizobiales bacterium 65-79]